MISWHEGLPCRTLTASLFQTPAKTTTLRRTDIEVIGEFTCFEPQLAPIRFTLCAFCWGDVVSPIISLTVPPDFRSGKSYLEDSTVGIAEDGCTGLDIRRIVKLLLGNHRKVLSLFYRPSICIASVRALAL